MHSFKIRGAPEVAHARKVFDSDGQITLFGATFFIESIRVTTEGPAARDTYAEIGLAQTLPFDLPKEHPAMLIHNEPTGPAVDLLRNLLAEGNPDSQAWKDARDFLRGEPAHSVLPFTARMVSSGGFLLHDAAGTYLGIIQAKGDAAFINTATNNFYALREAAATLYQLAKMEIINTIDMPDDKYQALIKTLTECGALPAESEAATPPPLNDRWHWLMKAAPYNLDFKKWESRGWNLDTLAQLGYIAYGPCIASFPVAAVPKDPPPCGVPMAVTPPTPPTPPVMPGSVSIQIDGLT